MSLDHYARMAGDCIAGASAPTLFLRFESPRERLALPYAGLTELRLSLDETVLTLLFVTHRVTVKGRKLHEAHCAIAAGSAAAMAVGRRVFRSTLSAANPARPAETADGMAVWASPLVRFSLVC